MIRVQRIKEMGKKLGIQSREDLIYFIGMFFLVAYLLVISFLVIAKWINPRFVYYQKIVLLHTDIRFPVIMKICIGLMYLSFLDWLIIGIASLFDRRRSFPPLDYKESFFVSILIPAHNEERVIEKILEDLSQQSYRMLEIIVIAHNCTDRTADKVRRQMQNDRRIKIIEYRSKESRKAIALNRGLKEVRGSIVINFDADNRIPDKDFIMKIVQYFNDVSISGVQVSLKVANHKNDILTMFQRMELRSFMNIFWRGRRALKLPCFLAGTGSAIRTDILKRYGGWNNSSLVEDFDLFVLLATRRKKIVYASELTVLDEKPVYWSALINQRARWLKGYLIVSLKYLLNFDNLVDYLYRLFPLSIFAWLGTSSLCIYYSLSGQVALAVISNWIWISWALVIMFFLFLSSWPSEKFKSIYLVPLYWLFTYHLVFVALICIFVRDWHHTRHFGEEV